MHDRCARRIRALLLVALSAAHVAVSCACSFDSLSRRKRAADRVQELVSRVKANPNDKEAIDDLERAARSSFRFERCYALGTIGELGELASPLLPAMIDGLKSADPFVRDSASQGLARLGPHAAPAKEQLIVAAKAYNNERTAMFAAEALGSIGDPSPDVLEALRFVAYASDSFLPEAARKSYFKLTGEQLPDSSQEASDEQTK